MTTTAQKEYIRGLLRSAGIYDKRTVTLMHRNLGVPDRWIGQPVDVWLDSLTKDEASALIRKLQVEEAEE